ncbi:MAG: hypothetical protein WBP55_12365, partial [Solirubrobacterales bacterium]
MNHQVRMVDRLAAGAALLFGLLSVFGLVFLVVGSHRLLQAVALVAVVALALASARRAFRVKVR